MKNCIANCRESIEIKVDKIIKIYPDAEKLAEEFAQEFVLFTTDSAREKGNLSIAFSGGSTPELFFTLLADRFSDAIPWKHVHLFWSDERCVPPDDPQSNFGMTWRTLLSRIEIPARNIHRIRGENDPEKEALRYSDEVSQFTVSSHGFPEFDIIMLGLGEDGHTASVFPGNQELLHSDKICEVAFHPVTLQKRITLTPKVINNASSVYFLVTGEKKKVIVERLFKKNPLSLNYPAAHIVPEHGSLIWYIDKDAGGLL
jgi:6-phosphogluconolactonase